MNSRAIHADTLYLNAQVNLDKKVCRLHYCSQEAAMKHAFGFTTESGPQASRSVVADFLLLHHRRNLTGH